MMPIRATGSKSAIESYGSFFCSVMLIGCARVVISSV